MKIFNRFFMTLGLFLSSIIPPPLTPSPAHAQLRVGAQVGSATGLSAQLDLSALDALNLSLAYDLRAGWALASADYRRLSLLLSGGRGRGGRVGLYWGAGVAAGGRRASFVSARLPLGLEAQPAGWRLQLFVEVAPTLAVLPATDLGVMGAIGARWTL